MIRHPTFGLWPVALRDLLQRDLLAGQRKAGLWAEAQGAVTEVFPATPVDPFLNINPAKGLTRAEALL